MYIYMLSMYVCMFVCMYACMYVCIYLSIYLSIYQSIAGVPCPRPLVLQTVWNVVSNGLCP